MSDDAEGGPRLVLGRVVPGYTPTRIESPPQGHHKETIVARYDDRPTTVVQLTDDPETAQTEAALLGAIRDRTAAPVPRLLARGSLGSRGYLVTEYVDGEVLHERFAELPAPTRERLARRFGHLLARLHEAFVFDAAGPITVDAAGTLTATGPSSTAFSRAYGQRGVAALPDAFDDLLPAIEDAIASRPTPTARPRLFPWDLRPGNAVVSDGELAAVVDWAEPLAADPALAVAKVEHLVADWYVADPEPLREAFREGYASVRPLPDVPVADRVTAVVQSAVDSTGTVTRPRYPELTGDDAVAVHRAWLDEWLPEG